MLQRNKNSFDGAPASAVSGPLIRNGLVVIGLSLFLSACQTSGGDGVLSGLLPKSDETADQQQASTPENSNTRPGENPNANLRLKNTQNALSNYCPAVRIREGTESLRITAKGKPKDDPRSVRYQANITKVARECEYVGDRLTMKIGARGRVIAGPAGASGDLRMPIRVAVTQGGTTVYSKLHRQTASLGGGNQAFQLVDDAVDIPAPTALNVRVYVGFDEGPYNTP